MSWWPGSVPARRLDSPREPRAIAWPPVTCGDGDQLVTVDADGDLIGGMAGELRFHASDTSHLPFADWREAIRIAEVHMAREAEPQ